MWFGESWGAPMCEPDEHAPTPVGVLCFQCEEAVEEGDKGVLMRSGDEEIIARLDPDGVMRKVEGEVYVAAHIECHLRSVLGSVAHIEGRCSCHGGDEHDPPGLSRRDAARAACAAWERTHGSSVR